MATIAELRQQVSDAANRFSVAEGQLDACRSCKSPAALRKATLDDYCQAAQNFRGALQQLAEAVRKIPSIDEVYRFLNKALLSTAGFFMRQNSRSAGIAVMLQWLGFWRGRADVESSCQRTNIRATDGARLATGWRMYSYVQVMKLRIADWSGDAILHFWPLEREALVLARLS
jgi:hypothetical protein